MASFVFRVKSVRISNISNCGSYVQKAYITSRGTRGGPIQLPEPFPYEEKKYRWYHKYLDNTMLRVSEENAKIITVEGPIGVGKTAFAKALAQELDMLHMEAINPESYYILPSGYDLRQLDPQLPKVMRSFDHKNFCKNPTDVRSFALQYQLLGSKFFQYADALAHLLNTGQGVVIERSYYSDYVFAHAMYSNNFLSKNAFDIYLEVRKNTLPCLLPNHLTIYLDIPVPVVQERIRTRNYSYEQNSPALTTKFLEDLEHYYKNLFLPFASQYSEILVYDWVDGGDVELISEDIEKLDLSLSRVDRKFSWWQMNKRLWTTLRKYYTNKKYDLGHYLYFYPHQWVEGFVDPNEIIRVRKLIKSIPDMQYDLGYNMALGDKFWNILFKSNTDNRRLLRPYLYWTDT